MLSSRTSAYSIRTSRCKETHYVDSVKYGKSNTQSSETLSYANPHPILYNNKKRGKPMIVIASQHKVRDRRISQQVNGLQVKTYSSMRS